jgi:hypothetical protein
MVTVRIDPTCGGRGVALSDGLEPRSAGLSIGGPFQGFRLDCGVCAVIWSFRSNLGSYRRAGALVLITLATIAGGCGSSGPAETNVAGKSYKQVLKEDQLYKYEGEGTAKRKVELSHRERVELLREAKKAE